MKNFIKYKTYIFYEFQSQDDILKYGDIKSKGLIAYFSLIAGVSGGIPIPFTDVGIMIALKGSAKNRIILRLFLA